MSLSKKALEEIVDEALPPPKVEHGMSLDEAIHEFVRIDARTKELSEERRQVMEALTPHAWEVRGGRNTARLEGSDKVKLKIEFKQVFRCDFNLLNEVKEMLGDDVFETLFKTEYAPRALAYRAFLASKSTDERVETAKEKIREAVTEAERAPYITVESA